METMMNMQTILNLPKSVVDNILYDAVEDQVSVVEIMRVLTGSNAQETANHLGDMIIAYPDIAFRINMTKCRYGTIAMCDFETLVKVIMSYPSTKLARVRVGITEKMFARDRMAKEFATAAAYPPPMVYVNAVETVYHAEAICKYYGMDCHKHATGLDRQLAAAYCAMFGKNPHKCAAKIGYMSCNSNAYTFTEMHMLKDVIEYYIYTH